MIKTIFFNKIYVIESLSSSDVHTGSDLYNDLLRFKVFQMQGFTTQLMVVNCKKEFEEALEMIYREIDPVLIRPYIHFEIHGSKDGFVLNNSELISWNELYNSFRKINFLLKNQLYISLASCYGAYLFKIIDPTKQSPFFGFVGNTTEVASDDIAVGFYEYFVMLLETLDLSEAIKALNNSNPNLTVPYVSIISESIFKLVSGKLNSQGKTRAFKLAKRKEIEMQIRNDSNIKRLYSKSELKQKIKEGVNRRDKDLKIFEDYFLFKRDSPAL